MPDDLTPQMNAVLDTIAEAGIPRLHTLTPQQSRDLIEALTAARLEKYPAPEVHSVHNLSTGAGYGHVPVRIYRASNASAAPVIVYYHGGGHVFGSLETHDTACRYLCREAGCAVVSVDYRMGPEFPFPAAVDDSYDALRWVADKADMLGFNATKIAVSGDSAGGNLAAVVALMAREAGGACAFGPGADLPGRRLPGRHGIAHAVCERIRHVGKGRRRLVSRPLLRQRGRHG